jgi:hypothetical protein
MAYSYNVVSSPSDSGGLDFGLLPKLELGDIKSLTSFNSKQREMEEKDVAKASELSKLLFDSMKDNQNLDWAIGDHPEGRKYYNSLMNYYTQKLDSLVANAGKPGIIRQLSMLENELRNDMYSPTGRLAPYVNAANEKKKYDELTKTDDYQKALSSDYFYDLENRSNFMSWKGALGWDEFGNPRYNKIRVVPIESAVDIQKIYKDVAAAVDEKILEPGGRRGEFVTNEKGEPVYTGSLIEYGALKGRDPNDIMAVLRNHPDFLRFRQRAITRLGDNPTKEELEELDKQLFNTFVRPLLKTSQSDPKYTDDPNHLNLEEKLQQQWKQADFNFRQSNAARSQANADRSYNLSLEKLNYQKRRDAEKDSRSKNNFGHIGGVTTMTGTSSILGNEIYENEFDASGNISPSKVLRRINNSNGTDAFNLAITKSTEYIKWLSNIPYRRDWAMEAIANVKELNRTKNESFLYPSIKDYQEMVNKYNKILDAAKKNDTRLTAWYFIEDKYSNDPSGLTAYLESEEMKPKLRFNDVAYKVPINTKGVHDAKGDRSVNSLLIKVKSLYNLPKGVSWEKQVDSRKQLKGPYVSNLVYKIGSRDPYVTVIDKDGKETLYKLSLKDNAPVYQVEQFNQEFNKLVGESASSTELDAVTKQNYLYIDHLSKKWSRVPNLAETFRSSGGILPLNVDVPFVVGKDRFTLTRSLTGNYIINLKELDLSKEEVQKLKTIVETKRASLTDDNDIRILSLPSFLDAASLLDSMLDPNSK